jgi:hypothetical protein
MNIQQDFEELLKLLEEHKVEYLSRQSRKIFIIWLSGIRYCSSQKLR